MSTENPQRKKPNIGNIIAMILLGIGIICMIFGYLISPTLEGPIASTTEHAILDDSLANLLMIGGLITAISAVVIGQVSTRKKKKKN